MSEIAELVVAKVYTDEQGQHLTLPPEFHVEAGEVYLRRAADGGFAVLPQAPKSGPKRTLQEILAELDADPFPAEFMQDRDQGVLVEREPL